MTVNSLIIHHEGTVRVQSGVVGLHHSSGHLRDRVELGLLVIIVRYALHQQGGQTRASATSKAVENQEALETSALNSLREGESMIKYMRYSYVINYIGAKLISSALSVPTSLLILSSTKSMISLPMVSMGVVAGSILLARDQLLSVEQLALGPRVYLIRIDRFKQKYLLGLIN